MKVVYAGPLDQNGTCISRLRALQSFPGVQIFPFDTALCFDGRNKWLRRMELAVSLGPAYWKLNMDFRALCLRTEPQVIWVDKGFWLWPSTLRLLKRNGARLVQHNTDSLKPGKWNLKLAYRLMNQALPLYDLYFTTNTHDFDRLSGEDRPPKTELTFLGYDHEYCDDSSISPSLREIWQSSILFAGHYEPRTEKMILALVRGGLPVAVYGPGWEKAEHKKELHPSVRFRPLNRQEYLLATKSAKIGLGIVSEWNGNQSAGRSFEIPACGTFLLAMRTPQHQHFYEEGKEAEFFGDSQELVEKARFYLNNDALRQEIARRGRQRCVQSRYSWADQMKRDWATVLKQIENKFSGTLPLERPAIEPPQEQIPQQNML